MSGGSAQAQLRNQKIVLIEDDRDLFELVSYNLKKEGYEVTGSQTGGGTVELCERQRPDLILLDVMLPDSDGFDICRRIKAHHLLQGVPIIFLTARGTEADRVLGLELGAVDYMVKPFSMRELALRIKRHLEQPRSVPNTGVLRVGPLELDHYRHRVALEGCEVMLTATEFRLLDYFMSRPGVVLSRGQLLEGVWGHGEVLTERVIDVYVLRLRSKIESGDAGYCFLHSVRGYGYRFDAPDSVSKTTR